MEIGSRNPCLIIERLPQWICNCSARDPPVKLPNGFGQVKRRGGLHLPAHLNNSSTNGRNSCSSRACPVSKETTGQQARQIEANLYIQTTSINILNPQPQSACNLTGTGSIIRSPRMPKVKWTRSRSLTESQIRTCWYRRMGQRSCDRLRRSGRPQPLNLCKIHQR